MRMSATTLDLSRFPAPLAIRGVNFEAILAARLTRLKQLFSSVGIDWDVGALETDPATILEQADAYREMLAIASVNDAVRATMVAFATGSDLDHRALDFGVLRRVISPATDNTPAIMENDAEFRRRVLLAPEAFAAAGPAGAYAFHALTADPRVLNVDVWSPARGDVTVALQSREGDGTAPTDLIAKVRAYLQQDSIQPLTDVVTVRSVVNVPFAVEYVGYSLPGPDPEALKALVEEGIAEVAMSRRTPARDMPRSALIAGGSVSALDKLILVAPSTDIAMGFGEVATLTAISGHVVTYAG